ncbi:MAG: nitroreductase family protein [Actinomycetota bacterium]
MEFARVVKRRRMCRGYLERDVSPEQVDRILDLAARFPSAGHTQPQEFIVVRDQAVKDRLGRAALDQMFIAQAPVVIAVVSDTRRSATRYGSRGVDFYSVLDGGFASMLVLLAAVDTGLGAAFVAAFDDDAVREVLGLPRRVRPIGLIAIGYCAQRADRHERRARTEIIHAERWSGR